jgi:subtilisin family serine protease
MPDEPVRVAVIDSGVSLTHPQIGPVAVGVTIRPDGSTSPDYFDRLGHGTAVAVAIRERAPRAELLVVKVFDWTLTASVETLVSAIDWAAHRQADLINLSLGTTVPDHARLLRQAVDDASQAGALLVAARAHDGVDYLPGSLPGVVPVELDWGCPRLDVTLDDRDGGPPTCRASGYPRPMPEVSSDNELSGLSLAVANVTGVLARELRAGERASATTAIELLRRVEAAGTQLDAAR